MRLCITDSENIIDAVSGIRKPIIVATMRVYEGCGFFGKHRRCVPKGQLQLIIPVQIVVRVV